MRFFERFVGNDGKQCDCECGMTDPDCLQATLEVKYCNKKDNEICSPLGRCTQAVYPSAGTAVSVSQACHRLTMPGETDLYGYKLLKDTKGTLYIWDGSDENTLVTIADENGGNPSFDHSHNWGAGSHTSAALAAEQNSDGTFSIAIKKRITQII